ncbi:unnamed protein product [Phytophthora fragariaefolia]|uniref:Unnamed protein product n=1 Tax=Phytophthora fragariaefolia TaxID=1490495 RepID=A0A9W7D4W0_9STRA|nr:unnamed protein product [Phytophthora fragariaefolia]
MAGSTAARQDVGRVQHFAAPASESERDADAREAAGSGRLDVVKLLTEEQGADVHAKNAFGCTALMKAAENGHVEVVKYLADERGADVDVKNHDGCTPLMWAAEGGHVDAVRCLAGELGADVNVQDNDGETALMWVAKQGRLDAAKCLAKELGADANVKDNEGKTALMVASLYGHLDVVKYLAEACDAGVNMKDNDGYSALMWAALHGHIDVVKCLIEELCADANVKNMDGETVLMMAANYDHRDVVKYLVEERGADVNIKNNDGKTALIWSVFYNNTDIVKYLAVECGADVNMGDNKGYTALVWAALGGYVNIIKFLAEECGADANVRDNDGCTALIWAAENGHLDVVKCLAEEFGAAVDVKTNSGFTAMVRAAQNDHMDAVKYLTEAQGADVNVTNNDGSTALMWAAGKGYIDIVKYLIDEHGAGASVRNTEGSTALLWAAQNGHVEVVKYLPKNTVNVRNNDGHTALMLAAENGHLDIVKYLAEEHGADANVMNNDGDTALIRAAQYGKYDTVRCLVEHCDADVNIRGTNGLTAVRIAADGGYFDIQRILMPQLSIANKPYFTGTRETNTEALKYSEHFRCSIPPLELELTLYSQNGSIGGDFRAKWLDADAAVKLFISDVAHSEFEEEVHLWQRLRHPNVIKMYGACEVGPHLQFFVCEYTSQGSLWEHVKQYSPDDSYHYDVEIRPPAPTVWKYLQQAALGLEYLHERGIVHGDLRCGNILIGSDDKAKLSNFDLSGRVQKSSPVSVDTFKGTMRWQAPEVLKGNPPSTMSDVYSLGMCVLEAVTGKRPWGDYGDRMVENFSKNWDPRPGGDGYYAPYCPSSDASRIVWRMCCQNPQQRTRISSIVAELESLALKESPGSFQPEQEPAFSFQEYECGKLEEAWLSLQLRMETCDNTEYRRIFDQLQSIHECLQVTTHPATLFDRFYEVLTDLYRLIKMSPDQAQIMQLSSTRAPTSSLYAFQWRIDSLLASLGVIEITDLEAGRGNERIKSASFFASGVADTILLLNNLKSEEERSAFLRAIKAEIEDHPNKYTLDQLEAMKKAYEDITAKLEGDDLSELAPEWFIPWYELVVDEWNCLGEGGFGSVNRAKWLDSEVVVKRVTLAGSRSANTSSAFDLSESDFFASADPSASQVESDAIKRTKALAMFRREVDIWFGFSHPHVVRLFGACHVGRPFFVCEFATNGTLVRSEGEQHRDWK